MTEQWTTDAPSQPGTYQWRRSWQWEPIEREAYWGNQGGERRLVTFSHRYAQEVLVQAVGGEWCYSGVAQ